MSAGKAKRLEAERRAAGISDALETLEGGGRRGKPAKKPKPAPADEDFPDLDSIP